MDPRNKCGDDNQGVRNPQLGIEIAARPPNEAVQRLQALSAIPLPPHPAKWL